MAETVLSLDNLSAKRRDAKLSSLSFNVSSGESLLIIERSQNVRVLLGDVLTGIVPPDSGSALLKGYPPESKYGRESLAALHRLSNGCSGLSLSAVKRLYRAAFRDFDEAAFAKYVRAFGLNPKHEYVRLSPVFQALFFLALSLSRPVQLLFIREPKAGFDPLFQKLLLPELRVHCTLGGAAVLLTDPLSPLTSLGERVALMDGGQLLALESRDTFYGEKLIYSGRNEELPSEYESRFINVHRNRFGFEALGQAGCAEIFTDGTATREPTAEDMSLHYRERKKRNAP